MFDIEVIGVKFNQPNIFGDFSYMCKLNECTDSLFIFNDNEEHHHTNNKGGGNAIMRFYNKYSILEIPISAGIPTGTLKNGGYSKFNSRCKKQIDDSINEIIELIQKYNYKKIYYSSEFDGRIGTGIFNVNEKVLNYITFKIYNLTNNPIKIIKLLPNNFYDMNYELDSDFDFDFDSDIE